MATEDELKINAIKDALNYSDIVWPKYGKETVDELARRIFDNLVYLEIEKDKSSEDTDDYSQYGDNR